MSCQWRTPNLRTEDVILYCLIRALAQLRVVIYEYGEMVEWWLTHETQRNLGEIHAAVQFRPPSHEFSRGLNPRLWGEKPRTVWVTARLLFKFYYEILVSMKNRLVVCLITFFVELKNTLYTTLKQHLKWKDVRNSFLFPATQSRTPCSEVMSVYHVVPYQKSDHITRFIVSGGWYSNLCCTTHSINMSINLSPGSLFRYRT